MKLNIRRTCSIIENKNELVVAILENPYVSRYVEDLSPLIEASAGLGTMMGQMAMEALGSYQPQSFGKGGLVGSNGEAEHASALLTTAYANPLRDAIGGGKAWISSMVKTAGPCSLIDIPMNHKDDIYVRSHYDGMSIVLPDAPMPDEIAIIFCIASAGRINARVGGLTHEEVIKREVLKG
jgi:hypothetical protein